MDLGQRVKAARERAGLSQDELAQRAGIPRSTLSGIEAHSKQPRTSTLANLARALQVSLDELMDHRAIVVSVQEADRNVRDVIMEVSSILESAMTLSAGIREQSEMRTSEARTLSQAVTSLGAAATTSSESLRMMIDEVIALRHEVASLRDRVLILEQAPPNYAQAAAQTLESDLATTRSSVGAAADTDRQA